MYKITGVIVIMLLFVSCGTFLRMSNKIEESHYALYKQKALLVYAVKHNKVLLTNPTNSRCYFLKGKQYITKWAPGDTLIIENNLEDFYSLKFSRKCNL
jgi:hypothetical protein